MIVSLGLPMKFLIIKSMGQFFTTETLSIFGYKLSKVLKIFFLVSADTYLGDSLTEIIPIACAPNFATWRACSSDVSPQILTKVLVLGLSLACM